MLHFMVSSVASQPWIAMNTHHQLSLSCIEYASEVTQIAKQCRPLSTQASLQPQLWILAGLKGAASGPGQSWRHQWALWPGNCAADPSRHHPGVHPLADSSCAHTALPCTGNATTQGTLQQLQMTVCTTVTVALYPKEGCVFVHGAFTACVI